ncbi:hypothetical protein DTO217A2_4377 [Paecilomyces variotii]|nr:hypothetical protein DTO217A2_4377 [Paecilomyces variotii]KAJ9353892.1 hypothetical protein DTO027B9_5105 [Paecilomyces variotii]KAJ9394140.1 hypothetical protein DTO282F9_8949 [Paecilomyces variotii]
MQQLQQYGPQILERGSQYPCKCDAYVLHIFPFMQKSRSLLIDDIVGLIDSIDYHFTISTHAAKRIYDSIIKFRTTSKFLKRRIFYD